MNTQLFQNAQENAAYLEAQCAPWHSKWQDVARYVLPAHSMAGGDESDDTRIIDATATRALCVLAAGLQSGLTPPARPWFRLRLADAEREENSVRVWLHDVEMRLYHALAHSNFYQNSHALFTELAAFGSADLYVEADAERSFRFSVLPCGEFAWGCNASGNVESVVHRLRIPARQLALRYGEDKLSTATRRMARKTPYDPVEILHLVRPREQRNPAKQDNLNMPFESFVWEATSAVGLLAHSGYNEFPHLCARWECTGTAARNGIAVYGRSPVMDALPDIKMLQEMARSQLLAVHKVVNPPMRVPAGFKQRLNLIPGAQNYVNPTQPDALSPLYQISPDLQAISNKIDDVRQSIRQGLFNDLFLLFANDDRAHVTAAEIMERSQEKFLMLGPVVERHQTDILDPLITRCFGLLQRAGKLPPAPLSLQGREIKVEYVSSLAQAQRASMAQGIRQLAADVASFASFAPEVLDKLNFDKAVDELAEISGAPARVLRSDKDVQKEREERRNETRLAGAAQLFTQTLNKKNA